MHRAQQTRSRFAEVVLADDDAISLGEATLLIAAEEYLRLDIDAYLEKLDYFGDLARERAGSGHDAADLIGAVNSVLFEKIGFHGNRKNYYDPRNSFLNEVIDRRTGIPITLTVVYIEVAKRIGFPIQGVGFPFHFLAKHQAADRDIFIDPFNEGRLLGHAGCEELLAEMSGGKIDLRPEHLEAATSKQILVRILSNLLGIYSVNDPMRALAAIDRILLITPKSSAHIRDRGFLLAKVGDRTQAIAELERYLELAPEAADRDSVRAQINSIMQSRARLN